MERFVEQLNTTGNVDDVGLGWKHLLLAHLRKQWAAGTCTINNAAFDHLKLDCKAHSQRLLARWRKLGAAPAAVSKALSLVDIAGLRMYLSSEYQSGRPQCSDAEYDQLTAAEEASLRAAAKDAADARRAATRPLDELLWLLDEADAAYRRGRPFLPDAAFDVVRSVADRMAAGELPRPLSREDYLRRLAGAVSQDPYAVAAALPEADLRRLAPCLTKPYEGRTLGRGRGHGRRRGSGSPPRSASPPRSRSPPRNDGYGTAAGTTPPQEQSLADHAETVIEVDSSVLSVVLAELRLLPAARQALPAVCRFPATWECPPPWGSSSTVLYPLATGCDEWSACAKALLRSLPSANVVAVSRVQNAGLYRLFALRVYRELGMPPAEAPLHRLFHGAKTREGTDHVTKWGLNRRFCYNGAYGDGVYAARDASYSNGGYVLVNPDGTREIFFCDVVVERHHVQDDFAPGVYCMRDFLQVYPAYLIKYRA